MSCNVLDNAGRVKPLDRLFIIEFHLSRAEVICQFTDKCTFLFKVIGNWDMSVLHSYSYRGHLEFPQGVFPSNAAPVLMPDIVYTRIYLIMWIIGNRKFKQFSYVFECWVTIES